MPKVNDRLNVYQGFNFKKDKQSNVGVLLSMKVGGQELKPDLETIKDPEQPSKDLKAVAVLDHYLWKTGPTDSMCFSGRLSTANRKTVAMLVQSNLTNIEVEFSYVIYKYDPSEKRYFKSNSHKSKLKGLVAKIDNGDCDHFFEDEDEDGDEDKLALTIMEKPADEVTSPENFTFRIGVKPQPQEQQVTLACALQMKTEMKWGFKSGK
jgi:hypothetical protein